jgi:hypothetical protein
MRLKGLGRLVTEVFYTGNEKPERSRVGDERHNAFIDEGEDLTGDGTTADDALRILVVLVDLDQEVLVVVGVDDMLNQHAENGYIDALLSVLWAEKFNHPSLGCDHIAEWCSRWRDRSCDGQDVVPNASIGVLEPSGAVESS